MLPARQIDVWKSATEMEKIQALVTLSVLPSRETTAGEIDNAAFMMSLDGVTRYGLSEAVKAIMQGKLGHGFLPSPPELRMQCDKAMEWHEREAEKIRRRERENADFNRQSGKWTEPTPAEKARVAALNSQFQRAADSAGAAEKEAAERAEIRARYGMSDEVLASIKDQPVPSNFKRASL